ncbi:hypothetical protein AGOR_G00002470 [Albula goreensis]|uniref:XRN2-binding (XTBD) domain-containing protein n=1 Tax=Albula goreensis TaxID=1534307 RepID=A0A8T3EAB1_9TELE|nr:hypothetical protein AGOR_G00002470 [Albula goreensis]
MAEEEKGEDIVSEFLHQNPHLAQWVESLRGHCETNKQWNARREFILRNMEAFPTIHPGHPSPSLDRLLSLSMVWTNHVFLGCQYPKPVMEKIMEMAEGVVVHEAPVRKTRDEIMGKGKRSASSGSEADGSQKKLKVGCSESESRSSTRPAGRAVASEAPKPGPPPQAVAEHQPFFNRLYKTVAWKLVSAGGFGPNLDHFDILRVCVEAAKASLSCTFVPLRDIPDLPAGRAQREGQVCELRCLTVYLGTGYGRDEDAARAMASKEALKIFQGRKVTVRICRRRFRGRDVEDLVLLDEQSRTSGLPPALSYPFQPEPATPSVS